MEPSFRTNTNRNPESINPVKNEELSNLPLDTKRTSTTTDNIFLNVNYVNKTKNQNEEPRLYKGSDSKMYSPDGSLAKEVQTLYGEMLYEDKNGLRYKSDGTLVSNPQRERSREISPSQTNFITKQAETLSANSFYRTPLPTVTTRYPSKDSGKSTRRASKSSPARSSIVSTPEKWKVLPKRDTKSADAHSISYVSIHCRITCREIIFAEELLLTKYNKHMKTKFLVYAQIYKNRAQNQNLHSISVKKFVVVKTIMQKVHQEDTTKRIKSTNVRSSKTQQNLKCHTNFRFL